jgi:hypothetical protein
MTFEQLLTDTLHSADDFAPSGDLFAKVQRSIEEDQAHRVRRRNTFIAVAAALAAIVLYLLAVVDIVDGVVTMSFPALEILVTAIMTGIVVAMGPAIRRFGETYERAVFPGSPETGRQVLKLLDIAYYLIFGAFILVTLMFEPPQNIPFWDRELTDQIMFQFARLGGLLLLMGALHVVLLISLPVIGLVDAANRRRERIADGAESTDLLAAKTDKGITFAVWIIAGLILLEVVGAVLALIAIIGASG